MLEPLAGRRRDRRVVAVYQGFVDLSFLNRRFWAYMIRASGTLGDPNKLGAVAAFWTVGAMVLARRLPRPWSTVIAIAALVLGIAAVWLSGSRTGLAAVIDQRARRGRRSGRAWRATRSARIDSCASRPSAARRDRRVAAIAWSCCRTHPRTRSSQRGTLGYVPFFGDRGIAESVNELLWDRFGYGPAAIQMIKEHPIDGVGVGTFHALVATTSAGCRRPHHSAAPTTRRAGGGTTSRSSAWSAVIPMLWWCVVFG